MAESKDFWVEETRSIPIKNEQKSALCEAMGASPQVTDDPNLMVIAIEFRQRSLAAG